MAAFEAWKSIELEVNGKYDDYVEILKLWPTLSVIFAVPTAPFFKNNTALDPCHIVVLDFFSLRVIYEEVLP